MAGYYVLFWGHLVKRDVEKLKSVLAGYPARRGMMASWRPGYTYVDLESALSLFVSHEQICVFLMNHICVKSLDPFVSLGSLTVFPCFFLRSRTSSQ